MRNRLDSALVYLWILNVIIVCSCTFSSGICLFKYNAEEPGRVLLQISTCTSFITIAELVINILILPLILFIYKKFDKRIHPEKYIPLSKEKLAQDLHDLAEAMLNDSNKHEKEDK